MKADKLTIKSQEAINDAMSLAESSGNPAIDTIHLLSALLHRAMVLLSRLLRKWAFLLVRFKKIC